MITFFATRYHRNITLYCKMKDLSMENVCIPKRETSLKHVFTLIALKSAMNEVHKDMQTTFS